MKTFHVKHDFNTYTPQVWAGSYVQTFGEFNKGFQVQAVDQYAARELLKAEYNLNPFYLHITEV